MRFLIAALVTAAPFAAWRIAGKVEDDLDTVERVGVTMMVLAAGALGVLACIAIVALWRWAL